MTAEEKAAQTAEGSYAHMSQQLELLKKAYKGLGEEGRNSDYGKELEETIQNLDAHLKDMAADMGEFQRNVGNYAVANSGLKKQYEEQIGTLAMLRTEYDELSEAEKSGDEGKKLAASIKEVSAAAKETKKTLDEQTKAVEDARKSLEGTSVTNTSVRRDLKELVLEIANLTIEYQKLSEEEKNSAEGKALAEHISDLTEKAGVLKDAISDTNAAITNAASDTRGLDQLTGSLQLAIDGFGLAQGAAAMLGISEGELAEIQTKLQAAIAASNAMQSIQNTLQSQSAVMQGVNLVQTRLRTVAENLHTAAQGKGVIATKALTVAQWAFNAAANANPIGLLIVGITACIAAVWGLAKAFTAIFGTSSEVIKSYQQQKQALEDMSVAHEKLIDRAKARGASEAELLQLSVMCKQSEKRAAEDLFAKARKLYDEDEEEYKEALEAKNKATEEYEKAKENGLNYLWKIQSDVYAYEREKEKGTLAYKLEIIEEEKKKQLELARILYKNGELNRQQYEDIVKAVNKAAQIKGEKTKEENTKKVSSSNSKSANDAKKQADELKKAVQAGEDALLQIITDSQERQRQAEILSYNRKLKELQKQLAKTKDSEVTMRTAINRQIEGLMAEHNRKMNELQTAQIERTRKAEADFIASHLAIVEKGSAEELEWKQKQLSNQYYMELLELKKSEDAKNITAEQAEEMRINLSLKYDKLREQAEEDHAKEMVEKVEKQYADKQSVQDNDYISELNALKTKYAKELAEAKGYTDKQEKIREKFEEDQAKLSENYAEQTARASVAMLEEVLKNEKLSAEDRLKYEQALAKAKVDLETAIADKTIEQIKRTTEEDNKAREKRMENAQKWLQVAADSLNTINDLVSAVYDAKIQKVEEEQDANTEAGEKEQERIQQMVEQNVITEEEGEARKRAAEAQTAKKNEELEKKKQQLKHKQAVWDRANSIAQATISTSLAIMNMLKSSPWPVNIAMAAIAGAMGAVQIATILATPIPKYAKGTDKHKGGPAIVGDGGVPELVVFGDKSWITPDKPTIVDLPAGAIVKPTIDGIDGDTLGLESLHVSGGNSSPVIINNDYRRLEDKMDRFIFVMQKHSNRQYQYTIGNSANLFVSDRL